MVLLFGICVRINISRLKTYFIRNYYFPVKGKSKINSTILSEGEGKNILTAPVNCPMDQYFVKKHCRKTVLN